MSFVRKIRKGDAVYLARVENKRVKGKVVQKVIKYLGREIEGKTVKRVNPYDLEVTSVKHYADVLVVDSIARTLRLDELLGQKAKYVLAITYSHLIERPSISKLEEWFQRTEIPSILGIEKVSTSRLYNTLGELSETNFSRVEEGIYSKVREYESDRKAAIIDVTDTYFEGKGLGDEPRRGKDGKVSSLLQIGLGVTLEQGFPIMVKTYNGNISNLMIFQDLFTELRTRGFEATVIDRGMGSTKNLERILQAEMKVVAGLKKTPKLVKNFLSKIDREEIYSSEHRVKLKNTSVYTHTSPYLQGELIAVYNPGLEVVRRELGYEAGKRDEELKYVGFSLIYHNTDFKAAQAVKTYYDKDIIDRAFKKIKGILALRPVRVWMREQVEGHVRVCYLAYAILSLLDYHCKKHDYSVLDALEKLKTGYKVYFQDKKTEQSWQTSVVLDKELEDLLKELGVIYK